MRFKFVVILFYFMSTLVVVFINHEIGAYAQSSSSTQLKQLITQACCISCTHFLECLHTHSFF